MIPLVDSATTTRRMNLLQGMVQVTDDPALVLSTVLGSCVACCLYDADARVGGMNHFLLPEPGHGQSATDDRAGHYGSYAMEALVQAMLRMGASLPTMQAHLYGGANVHAGMRPIGTENGRFARRFLARRGIRINVADLGGDMSRRVDFRAVRGQVRCRRVRAGEELLRSRSPVGDYVEVS